MKLTSMRWVWLVALAATACGGSEFETAGEVDASAGSGGSAGAGGTGGVGGSAGVAGTGGTAGAAGTGGTGAVGGAGGDAGSGGATCPTECIAFPPSDWRGPAEVRTSSNDVQPECSGHYGIPADLGFAEFTVEPSDCQCTCDGNFEKVFAMLYAGADCVTNPCTSHNLENGVCFTPTNGCAPGAIEVEPAPNACEPAVSEFHPPPEPELHVAVCESADPPSTDGCPQGTFCPVLAGNAVCVWSAGDKPVCPPAFPDRRVMHHAFDDDRGCSPCECRVDGSFGTVTRFTQNNCPAGTEDSSIDVPVACSSFPATGAAGSFRYAKGPSASDSCVMGEPSGPVGSVEPIEPTTICCFEK